MSSQRRGKPFKELLLVVCTANVARSPLAAAMLERNLLAAERTDIDVASAGVKAMVGIPVQAEAMEVAAMRGLDISQHVVQDLDHRLAEGADLIVAMTESQRDLLVRAWPNAVGRTFTLLELDRLLTDEERFDSLSELAAHAHSRRPVTLASSTPEDVDDPAGTSLRSYKRTTDQLDRLVTRLTEHLTRFNA